MDLKKVFTLNLIETAIRIWTSVYIMIYGFAKPFQFEGSKSLDVCIKDATELQMMWAFFGTTQAYPIIIGCFEVFGALLLVFRKTKLLGALLLTPVFVNIILLDIFYKIHPGALLNAIIYQCVFIFIMIQQRKKIAKVFHTILITGKEKNPIEVNVVRIFLAVNLAVLFFMGFQLLT